MSMKAQLRFLAVLLGVSFLPSAYAQRFQASVPTLSALLSYPIPNNNSNVWVTSRTTVGDGFEGVFTWHRGDITTPTNILTVFETPAPFAGRWIRNYSGPINVRWSGALGQGANETALIKAAYDAIDKTTGGELYFPVADEWRFNLRITNFNIGLLGTQFIRDDSGAPGSNFVSAADVTLPIIQVGDGTNYAKGFRMIGLQLRGNGTNGVGLRLSGGAYAGYYDFKAYGFQTNVWIQGEGSVPASLNNFYNYSGLAANVENSRNVYVAAPDAGGGWTVDNKFTNPHFNSQIGGTNTYVMELDGTIVDVIGGRFDLLTNAPIAFNLTAGIAVFDPVLFLTGTTIDGSSTFPVVKCLYNCTQRGSAVIQGSYLINGAGEMFDGSILSQEVLISPTVPGGHLTSPVIQGTLSFMQGSGANSRTNRTWARAEVDDTDSTIFRLISTNGTLEIWGRTNISLATGDGSMTNRILYVQPGTVSVTNSLSNISSFKVYGAGAGIYSDTNNPTVRIFTAGVSNSVASALHLDSYQNTPAFPISLDFGLMNSTNGESTSRIIHFANVNTNRASSLLFQTHTDVQGVWNNALALSTNGWTGIGITNPAASLDVVGDVQIRGTNINIRGVQYVWPATQGGAATVLTDDGAGNLTWSVAGGGGGATNAIVSLNGLTNSTQSMVDGGFGASSSITSSVATHTFLTSTNFPMLSATNNINFGTEVVTGTTPAINFNTPRIKTWALSANSTPTFANIPSATDLGRSIEISVTNTTFTIDWDNAVYWPPVDTELQPMSNTVTTFVFKWDGVRLLGYADQLDTGGSGGGTTINPTDTFIPYRLNSTTFADSPMEVASATLIDSSATFTTISGTAAQVGYGFGGGTAGLFLDGTGAVGLSVGSNQELQLGINALNIHTNAVIGFSPDPGTFSPDVTWRIGAGTPEGVVSAQKGSLFVNRTGDTNTMYYIKSSGTGNTGWTPLITGGTSGGGGNTNGLEGWQQVGAGANFNFGANATYEKIQYGTTGPSFTLTNAGTYQVIITLQPFNNTPSSQHDYYVTNVTDSVAGPVTSVSIVPGGSYPLVIPFQVTTTGANKNFEVWGATSAGAPTCGNYAAGSVVNILYLGNPSGGSGGGGNMFNTGANAVGTVPRASDTSATNYVPSLLIVAPTTGNMTLGDDTQASITRLTRVTGTDFQEVLSAGGVNIGTAGFSGGSLSAAGAVGGSATIGANGAFLFSASTRINASTNGWLRFANFADGDFYGVRFGGFTATNLMILTTNTGNVGFHFKLADNSAYTGIYASEATLGSTNVSGAISGKQPIDADLTAIAALTGTGLLSRTGAGTYAERAATAGANMVIVNGDGVAGNPTLSVATSPTFTNVTLASNLLLPDDIRQTFNPGATVAGINVGSQAGDPSTPIDGDIWYDSTGTLLRARINGATVSLGAGGGGTPGGSDTQVQFNDGGAFGGDAGLTYNKTTDALTLGASGVRITPDGDGALTFLGLGDGTDEDLTWNFDDTPNTVVVSSSTGVTGVSFGSMSLTAASGFTVDAGTVVNGTEVRVGGSDVIGWHGGSRSRMTSGSDGNITFQNAGTTGFTKFQLGPDDASPDANVTVQAASGVGSNIPGGGITTASGQGTGTGIGGPIIQATSVTNAVAATTGSLVTRSYVYAGDKELTESTATGVFTITLAARKWQSVIVFASTHADDNTDTVTTTDEFNISLNAKTTVITSNISTLRTSTIPTTGGAPKDIKCSIGESIEQNIPAHYIVVRNRWRVRQ